MSGSESVEDGSSGSSCSESEGFQAARMAEQAGKRRRLIASQQGQEQRSPAAAACSGPSSSSAAASSSGPPAAPADVGPRQVASALPVGLHGGADLEPHEEAAIADVRKDPSGYVYVPDSAAPIGRIYANKAKVVQYQVKCFCTRPDHSKCAKWISSRHVPDTRRFYLWLLQAREFANASSHLASFARIVRATAR